MSEQSSFDPAVFDDFIAVLEEVHAAQSPFNLTTWGGHLPVEGAWLPFGSTVGPDETVGNPELTCGTTACACGYAALDPRFQVRGFRLVLSVLSVTGGKNQHEVGSIRELNEAFHHWGRTIRELTVHYDRDGADPQHFEAFEAAAALLDIPMGVSYRLFHSEHYERDGITHRASALDVAERLCWVRDYKAAGRDPDDLTRALREHLGEFHEESEED